MIEEIINTCIKSEFFFFKYVSANDTGTTGSHQAGFYLPNNVWPMFFEERGKKGKNKDRDIEIKWNGDLKTESRVIWYGKGTRSEYRLTKGLTFLEDDNVGDVLVFTRVGTEEYQGFLLSNDEDIEGFFEAFDLTPNDSYRLQVPAERHFTDELVKYFDRWIKTLETDFPKTTIVSNKAREISFAVKNTLKRSKYDNQLLTWIDIEFQLFKYLENDRYKEYLEDNISSVDDLVKIANTILNRRKSRAGHSLENHLDYIFQKENIPFTAQARTEGRKKPDFIFPSIEAYHDKSVSSDDLLFLAAKRTCKDRWRQILNEANRIPTKHLITLQQGISENQLKEMERHNVQLIVPAKYKNYYPDSFKEKILDLETYIKFLNEKLSTS